MSTETPRLARWFLRLIPDAEARRFVRQDLDEEYERHVLPARGRAAARAWYRRMLVRSVLASWRDRIRQPADRARGAAFASVLADAAADLRYALRVTRRSAVISATVVVTIAGGIASTAAIASIVVNVLLAPLPFEDPGRLVRIERANQGVPYSFSVVGLPDMRAWRDRATSFVTIAGWSDVGATLTADGQDPSRISAAWVTEGLDRVLGVSPRLGRFFVDDEHLLGGDQVAVLSHGFWRSHFGGDLDVVGQTLSLDGLPYRVVGVLPAMDLEYPPAVDVWIPMAVAPDAWQLNVRGASWMNAVGRVRPDASPAAAQQELSTIQARLAAEFPRQNDGQDSVVLTPLKEVLVGDERTTIAAMAGSVALVLLIACVNVGVLLAARANRRRQEFAVRMALGARRGRLLRQLLTESTVLAAIGGGLGIVLAPALARAVVALYPGGLSRASEIRVDGGILLVAVATILLAGLAAGLIPATQLGRRRPDRRVTLQARRDTGGRSELALRGVLAAGQAALSVFVLVASALFVATLFNIVNEDPGFRTADVVTFRLSLPSARYAEDEAIVEFGRQLLDDLRDMPGVIQAGGSSSIPFGGAIWGGGFRVTGVDELHTAMVRIAWPRTYATLDIPVVAGRAFDQRDDLSAARVVMLNETAARTAFGVPSDAVGRAVEFDGQVWDVAGVLADIRHRGLHAEPEPEIHVPALQFPRRDFSVVLHAAVPPGQVVAGLREVVDRHDPSLPLIRLTTMEQRSRDLLDAERFRAVLVSGLGGAALVLALVGIYGVVASGVAHQRREIGVRLALGEARAAVVRRVILRSGRLATVGAVVGVVGILLASPRLAPLLYGISPLEPSLVLGVPAALVGLALLSALPAALRASRTDPATVMRDD